MPKQQSPEDLFDLRGRPSEYAFRLGAVMTRVVHNGGMVSLYYSKSCEKFRIDVMRFDTEVNPLPQAPEHHSTINAAWDAFYLAVKGKR